MNISIAPSIGSFSLLFIICLTSFLPIFVFIGLQKKGLKKKYPINSIYEVATKISYLILFASLLAQCCLAYSFIISDYSVANVYQNSHHLKPLIYKIAGSWGNHEGSMLLLISVIALYSVVFNYFSRLQKEIKVIFSASQALIILLFTAFTAFVSNPFARIFPAPKTGLGLNPVLQDIGLALHPPMLYAGYIGFSLIFSLVMAGLLSSSFDKQEFINSLKLWLLTPYTFLTIGVALGAWWAYRELGWGGYWFWDPVENVSLMPWIAATILIHCLKLVNKGVAYQIWGGFVAILTFILCLLGIFLTRSGVLTSVHSFAIDTNRGFFVMMIILIVSFVGFLVLGLGSKSLTSNISNDKSDQGDGKFRLKSLLETKNLLLLNNYLLLIALFVVMLGTLYPIFLRGFWREFISIGPDYYNRILSLALLPFIAFMIASDRISKRQFVIISSCATLLFSLFVYFSYAQIGLDLMQMAILWICLAAIVSCFFSRYKLPVKLAHGGFALIMVGIVLSSNFSQVRELNLKLKEDFEIANYKLKFDDIEYFAGSNFIARGGIFPVVQKSGKELGRLKPQLRYYPVSEQTTNEAEILHFFTGDLYLVIGNKDDESGYYVVRAYYKPFIVLIWIGCLGIVIGIAMKVLKKIKKIGKKLVEYESKNL